MAGSINLDKLSAVFAELASDGGGGPLDTLAKGLDAFRDSVRKHDLNDAEFKYLASALIQQRSNDFSSAGAEARRSVSAATNLRHGFVIKAKI
jgi:hypothetical protein